MSQTLLPGRKSFLTIKASSPSSFPGRGGEGGHLQRREQIGRETKREAGNLQGRQKKIQNVGSTTPEREEYTDSTLACETRKPKSKREEEAETSRRFATTSQKNWEEGGRDRSIVDPHGRVVDWLEGLPFISNASSPTRRMRR